MEHPNLDRHNFTVSYPAGRLVKITGAGVAPLPADAVTVQNTDKIRQPIAALTLIYECSPSCEVIHRGQAHMTDAGWLDLENTAAVVASIIEQMRELGHLDELMRLVELTGVDIRANWSQTKSGEN